LASLHRVRRSWSLIARSSATKEVRQQKKFGNKRSSATKEVRQQKKFDNKLLGGGAEKGLTRAAAYLAELAELCRKRIVIAAQLGLQIDCCRSDDEDHRDIGMGDKDIEMKIDFGDG
jgi:hypothetical protein